MFAHFPEKPYTITKGMWNSYRRDQESGHMNMMGHHLIGYFIQGDAWEQAHKHFETDGNDEDLVIE